MKNLSQRLGFLACSALSLSLLTGAQGGGCGGGLDNRPGDPGVDVGGTQGALWQVSYGDKLEVKVSGGGGVISTKTLSLVTGGKFTVDNIEIDLKEMCARGDITCPQDVFPSEVKMTQPAEDMHLLYVTFSPKGPLKDAGQTTLLGNVDSDDDFLIALGVGGAAKGQCGLLGISYATGRIETTKTTPPKGISLSGEIVTAYAGACAVAGQAGGAAAGLAVELRLPFTAIRKN